VDEKIYEACTECAVESQHCAVFGGNHYEKNHCYYLCTPAGWKL